MTRTLSPPNRLAGSLADAPTRVTAPSGGDMDSALTQRSQALFGDRLGISVEEFASAIGISRTSAWQAIWRGEVPFKRIGRRIIIPVTAVETWLLSPDAA